MSVDDQRSTMVALYAELHDLLDRIDAADPTAASDHETIDVADAHERAARRMASIGYRRVLEVSDRAAHIKAGYRSLHDFMVAKLRITNPGMRRKHIEALTSMRSMQGDVLAPRCPHTAQALREGAIGPDHVQRILEALRQIPAAVPADARDAAEATLARLARAHTPSGIAKLGARLVAHLDPDGRLTDDTDRARRRGLGLGDQDAQSMSRLTGSLDPLTRAMFDVLLDAWAAPGMNNPDDDRSPRGSKDDVDAELLKDAAGRDSRAQSQRNHDALKALLTAVLDGGLLGKSHRGLPPHLIIKITEAELRERAGVGETAGGAQLPIKDVIDLAARAQMHLAVFADHSAEVLYLGRAKRCANQSQRFALFARDGAGCTCPECTQPFTHLEIHHAEQDWADGGWTDIIDLAGSCPPHNRRVGPRPGQFTTHMVVDGPDAGRPAWTLNGDGPPDPPRVNRTHHLGEELAAHLQRGLPPPGDAPPERAVSRTRASGMREERRRVPRLISSGWSVRVLTRDDLISR
ncbi:DUF222 domain-containing protein [Gordonia sp. CPCC 206044]|uniref:HNH endonuclease signature motif containing protein n=1 Tax=Gordonia sp. CPCC 206044 TaxID=3140793 RepID=UPI003AF34E6F